VATSGGTTTSVDSNVLVPHTDEFDISYSRQFWGEASTRVAYVRKMFRDLYANRNILREGHFTVPFTTLVPITNFDTGAQGTQTFNLLDIPSSLRGQVQNQIGTVPDGWYDYDTIELAFTKRFSRGLFLDTSFDYLHRNELRANSASTNPFVTDPLGIGYFQDVYPAVPNRQTSSNWQFHLSGRYNLPFELGIGGNVQMQSGWPYARLITVSLPNAGSQTFFADRIANRRSDTVPLVGFRVDRAFPVGARHVQVMLDLFNVLNSNAITNFALGNGATYDKIIATLQPRTVELGVRLQF